MIFEGNLTDLRRIDKDSNLEDKMEIEKRFVFIAAKKGFITKEQAFEGLGTQVTEDLEGKKHRLIGEIMVSLGYMTDSQVDEVLQEI